MEKHDYLKIGFNLTHPSHFSFHNFLVEELCQISWILSLNLFLDMSISQSVQEKSISTTPTGL